jgi:hypothetical protein
MKRLGEQLDHESYEWLLAHHPAIAVALEDEIKAGATADEVRKFVIQQTQRPELAYRCEQAARWLASG